MTMAPPTPSSPETTAPNKLNQPKSRVSMAPLRSKP